MKDLFDDNIFSIVIPSYNQGRFLEKTLLSIINQDYSKYEIIVMDGGSTDESVDIIKKYEKYIYYWRSEKDNGQSAAINEGFRRSTGNIVTWLNSDDILLPKTLSRVNMIIKSHKDVNFFLGNVIWIDKYDKVLKAVKVERYSKYFSQKGLFANGGPTAFFRKTLLNNYGYLREDFNYMMDTELWNRWLHAGESFYRIKYFCWGLRLHEDAKMSGHNFENSQLADKNHPSWIQKAKEIKMKNEMYSPTTSFWDKLAYNIFKLFDLSVISRFGSYFKKNKLIYDIV